MAMPSYEEVELIKDFTRKTGTKRTVHITSGVGNPTVVLKKGSKIKETFNLMMVTAVETSKSTNLIQLLSDKGDSLMIRTKSDASKKKFLDYLKAGLPTKNSDSGGYEEPSDLPVRRARTAKTHDRVAPATTPRVPRGYQSGVPVQVTHLPSPVTALGALSILPDDEYDISDCPHPLISSDRMEGSQEYQDWPDQLPDHVYDEAPRSPIHHQYVLPGDSSTAASARGDIGYMNGRRFPPINYSTPSTEYPRKEVPGKRTQDEYTDLRADASVKSDQKPPPYMWCDRVAAAVQSPQYPTETDDAYYEPVNDPCLPGEDKQSHYERLLKCEMTQDELVTRGIERQSLLGMKMMVIDPHGVCITGVPASLKHSFYEGDRIVNINSQTITDREFARQIIRTSANDLVQMTTNRLFMGHLIDIELQDADQPIGVDLDGTKIKSIVPGSQFGKQAHRGLLGTEMCITHINTDFVSLDTGKKQVEEMLKDAGLSFFLILQPVDFAENLGDD